MKRLAAVALVLLGLAFPSGVARADCNLPSIGQTRPAGSLVFNSGYNVVQYCDGTVWRALIFNAGGGGAPECPSSTPIMGYDTVTNPVDAYGMWVQGGYVFVAQNTGIAAFSFDGTTWTHLDTDALTYGGSGGAIWGDGTYIYVARGTVGVSAFSFNGTAFTLIATYNSPGQAYDVSGAGGYIYLADDTTVRALTFNGTAWNFIASYNASQNILGVWAGGGHIFVTDSYSGVRALTFNGTTWTSVATWGSSDMARHIWGDGTYIYVGDNYILKALSFNGTSLTLSGSVDQGLGSIEAIHGANGYIYTTLTTSFEALTFDGANFAHKAYYPSTWNARGILSDGTYVYALLPGAPTAYPACGPL